MTTVGPSRSDAKKIITDIRKTNAPLNAHGADIKAHGPRGAMSLFQFSKAEMPAQWTVTTPAIREFPSSGESLPVGVKRSTEDPSGPW